MRDLTAFNARCRAAFPDFREARYNDVVGRYEIVTLSSAGKPVSQFFGWFRNPLTGEKTEPHEITGLVPFRELDATAQEEVFVAMEKTFIGNPHDGAGTHKKAQKNARAHNATLREAQRRKRAETIVQIFKEVDLRRPWVKHHPHAKDPRARRANAHHSR